MPIFFHLAEEPNCDVKSFWCSPYCVRRLSLATMYVLLQIKVGDPANAHHFVDGGLFANNPIVHAFK